ncbi:MAG: hypothetical protein P1U50_04620 [Parvibaculaceae bacterium]|nr:hypothetical protein [Parvibaculaceae bacterium]
MRHFMLGLACASTLSVGMISESLAERQTATGTRIESQEYSTSRNWGRQLDLPQSGKIVRVMDGTYGFQLVRADGTVAADFLFPEDAIGTELAAGRYQLLPLVCQKHQHHHVEVTVEY